MVVFESGGRGCNERWKFEISGGLVILIAVLCGSFSTSNCWIRLSNWPNHHQL